MIRKDIKIVTGVVTVLRRVTRVKARVKGSMVQRDVKQAKYKSRHLNFTKKIKGFRDRHEK